MEQNAPRGAAGRGDARFDVNIFVGVTPGMERGATTDDVGDGRGRKRQRPSPEWSHRDGPPALMASLDTPSQVELRGGLIPPSPLEDLPCMQSLGKVSRLSKDNHPHSSVQQQQALPPIQPPRRQPNAPRAGISGTNPQLLLSELGLPECVVDRFLSKGGRLHPWQAAAIDTAADGSSLVYCAPTSGGKSLVAEVLHVRRLCFRNNQAAVFQKQQQQSDDSRPRRQAAPTPGRALFVLPYVALVNEKTPHLANLLKPLELKVKGYAGVGRCKLGPSLKAPRFQNLNLRVRTPLSS